MRVAVKIQRLRDVPLPEYKTDGAAGFDLAPAEAVTVPALSTIYAPTGLVVQAPPNHMLMIVPRSSTWKKYRIELGNTIGIVDEDFCGPEDELLLCLRNGNMHDVDLPAGTRVAQGIFVPCTRGVFVEQDEKIAATRGGWGSTGS